MPPALGDLPNSLLQAIREDSTRCLVGNEALETREVAAADDKMTTGMAAARERLR